MMTPEFIDNVNKTLKSSLKEEIKPGSKISIAAACFSIYAYQELQFYCVKEKMNHFLKFKSNLM